MTMWFLKLGYLYAERLVYSRLARFFEKRRLEADAKILMVQRGDL